MKNATNIHQIHSAAFSERTVVFSGHFGHGLFDAFVRR